MRPFILILAAASAFILPAIAADPAPPSVKLVVSKQLMDSNHARKTTFKAYALRVKVTNTGKTTLAGASLSGTALVHRARSTKNQIVSEPLTSLEVPQLKPNGTVTLDLGTIELHKVVKMEETLDEWQVVLAQDGVELAKEQSSSRYEALSKEASDLPGKGGRKKRK